MRHTVKQPALLNAAAPGPGTTPAWVALMVVLALAACAGPGPATGTAPAAEQPATVGTSLESALREIDALATPAGMDPRSFQQAKLSLAALLAGSGKASFASTVPTSEGSAVRDLRIWNNGDGTGQCHWTYANEGDYNQDSQVTASDLTPLGIYFDRKHDAFDWPRARIADGNGDGLVAVTDITPIGQYFGQAVDGYIIEISHTPEDGDSWLEVAQVDFADGEVPAAGGNRRYNTILSGPVQDAFYRVVPVYEEAAGPAGEYCQYTGEAEPYFTVEGIVTDGEGGPLSGAEVTLGELDPVTTGADGTFAFPDIPDGYCAELTAVLDDWVFHPQSWVVSIDNAPVYGRYFAGRVLDSLEAVIPAEGHIDQPVELELRAVDADGVPVLGFEGSGQLTSDLTGTQTLAILHFVEGTAHPQVTFTAAGEYTLSVSGLGEPLDGEVGTITISEPPQPGLSVTKWHGDAEAAISLTFDDGTADHWSRGLPLWEEYGFRVTLGILKFNFNNAPERIPQLQEAFNAGHEIANHSANHPDFTTITLAECAEEVSACEEFLLSNIDGLDRIDTFIYPYEQFNEDVMELLNGAGYMYARSGYQGISDYAQLNDSREPPFLHLYSWANQAELPLWMWDNTTDWTVSQGDWLVEQCHGIGSPGEQGVGWSPRPESDFRSHYDHIKSFGDRIWVAPVREVGGYIMERNNAELEILETTGDRVDFILFDSLDNAVFDIPLTVRFDLPDDWTEVKVKQGLVDIPLVAAKDGYVLFDVTPGSGIVNINRQ